MACVFVHILYIYILFCVNNLAVINECLMDTPDALMSKVKIWNIV